MTDQFQPRQVILRNTYAGGRASAGLRESVLRGSMARPESVAGSREESRPRTNALRTLPLPAAILLVTLFIPWITTIGGLQMSPYRVVLLVMIVPTLFIWVRGKAGGFRLADAMFILYAVWGAISLAVVHG